MVTKQSDHWLYRLFIFVLFDWYYESLNSNLFSCGRLIAWWLVAFTSLVIIVDYSCIFFRCEVFWFYCSTSACSDHCMPGAHSYTAKHLGSRWGSSKVGLLNLTTANCCWHIYRCRSKCVVLLGFDRRIYCVLSLNLLNQRCRKNLPIYIISSHSTQ